MAATAYAKTLAGRLREIAETPLFGIIADEMTEAADLIDRLAAPEGVGLTRYAKVSDAMVEQRDGQWVRHEDAAAAVVAEKARADAAEERVEELETDAGRVSAEFEGDLWKAIRHVVESNPGFSWRDYEPEGMTADDVATLFSEDLAAAWADVERFKAKAEAAEAERDALKAALAEAVTKVEENRSLRTKSWQDWLRTASAALSKTQGGG